MALGLSRAGFNVMITAARNPGEIDAVANQAAISGHAGTVHAMVADVSSECVCSDAILRCLQWSCSESTLPGVQRQSNYCAEAGMGGS
jgi:hypothetical protein